MLISKKIRLEASEQDAATLEFMQGKCRGLYTFTQMLTYKCQLYGKDLQFLDERNTSKQCSGCGHLQAMPLWKRTYYCVECGLVMDRDENSAVNILMRFLAWLGPHTDDSVRCTDVFTATDNVEYV